MKHNQHARHTIEALYRNLKSNFISEVFCYSEDPDQNTVKPLASPVNLPLRNYSHFKEQSLSSQKPQKSQKNLSNFPGNRSQIDKFGLSSNSSLCSFTLGNSSLYLNNSSILNESIKSKAIKRNRVNNPWLVTNETCFFQPIKNRFYQKYVLKYTKFQPKLRLSLIHI